jgi:hypothetical protein
MTHTREISQIEKSSGKDNVGGIEMVLQRGA